MKTKLERVESKVVQKFRKSLTPRERELLATKVSSLSYYYIIVDHIIVLVLVVVVVVVLVVVIAIIMK